jgi:hypothetical protein
MMHVHNLCRLTNLNMKNAVFLDVALCRYCVNRRFGRTHSLHLQGRKFREQGTSVSRWLQTEATVENASACLQPPAHAGSSLADFSSLKMEAMRSFETSVHTNLHGATSRRTAFFIFTAVKTSNLTKSIWIPLISQDKIYYWMYFLLLTVLCSSCTQNVSGSLTDFQGWSLTRNSFRQWKQ